MAFKAKIGDRVVMKMDPEARAWGRQGVPDGTEGTIVGFYRYTRHEDRFGLVIREPGVYEANGAPTVLWDGTTEPEEKVSDLEFIDKDVEKLRRAEYHALSDDWIVRDTLSSEMVRIGDLPDTKFWQGDIVRWNPNFKRDNPFRDSDDCEMRVASINWGWEELRPDEGMVYMIEWITKTGEYAGRGTTNLGDEQLELVRRGPLWNEAHGEPLVFASLVDEASYAKNTGRSHEIRNPVTGLYDWTLEQALDALKTGDAHSITVDGGMLSQILGTNMKRTAVHVFDDIMLGNRLRLTTLMGFGVLES